MSLPQARAQAKREATHALPWPEPHTSQQWGQELIRFLTGTQPNPNDPRVKFLMGWAQVEATFNRGNINNPEDIVYPSNIWKPFPGQGLWNTNPGVATFPTAQDGFTAFKNFFGNPTDQKILAALSNPHSSLENLRWAMGNINTVGGGPATPGQWNYANEIAKAAGMPANLIGGTGGGFGQGYPLTYPTGGGGNTASPSQNWSSLLQLYSMLLGGNPSALLSQLQNKSLIAQLNAQLNLTPQMTNLESSFQSSEAGNQLAQLGLAGQNIGLQQQSLGLQGLSLQQQQALAKTLQGGEVGQYGLQREQALQSLFGTESQAKLAPALQAIEQQQYGLQQQGLQQQLAEVKAQYAPTIRGIHSGEAASGAFGSGAAATAVTQATQQLGWGMADINRAIKNASLGQLSEFKQFKQQMLQYGISEAQQKEALKSMGLGQQMEQAQYNYQKQQFQIQQKQLQIQQKTLANVAASNGLSEAEVRSRLHYALQQLHLQNTMSVDQLLAQIGQAEASGATNILSILGPIFSASGIKIGG
jgi:hypothetical protein